MGSRWGWGGCLDELYLEHLEFPNPINGKAEGFCDGIHSQDRFIVSRLSATNSYAKLSTAWGRGGPPWRARRGNSLRRFRPRVPRGGWGEVRFIHSFNDEIAASATLDLLSPHTSVRLGVGSRNKAEGRTAHLRSFTPCSSTGQVP